MLDPLVRRLIDPPLKGVAPHVPISPNAMTLIGFVCGLVCFVAIIKGEFVGALIALICSRFADGLDGALARQKQQVSDRGAYLDIVSDFLIWALLPLGFAIYAPHNAFMAAVLLSAFAMSMTVFLGFAIIAEKRGLTSEAQGKKSFFYQFGLIEGTETILFFIYVLLFPKYFIAASGFFAVAIFISVILRVLIAVKLLGEN